MQGVCPVQWLHCMRLQAVLAAHPSVVVMQTPLLPGGPRHGALCVWGCVGVWVRLRVSSQWDAGTVFLSACQQVLRASQDGFLGYVCMWCVLRVCMLCSAIYLGSG